MPRSISSQLGRLMQGSGEHELFLAKKKKNTELPECIKDKIFGLLKVILVLKN